MKKIAILMSLVLSVFFSNGQDIILNFAGSGAATTVDSVRIENFNSESVVVVSQNESINLTQGTVNKLSDVDNQVTNSLEIYPNPVLNLTNIQFFVAQTQQVNVQITDATGKIVAQINKEMPKGVNSCKFIPETAGLYFVKVSGKDFSYSSKIVSLQSKNTTSSLNYNRQISDSQKSTSLYKSKDVDFVFTAGDTLMLRGISGNYIALLVIIPTESTTYTFDFIECTDFDGNNYPTVHIYDQVWMAENLRTTHYSDGTIIPKIENDTTWSNTFSAGFCWYNNDSTSYSYPCGAIYNWYAAMGYDSKNNLQKDIDVCPTGWHLPSKSEWKALIDTFGGRLIAGGPLKARGYVIDYVTPGWYCPNSQATNFSGFSAFPIPWRSGYQGAFGPLVEYAQYWASTSESADLKNYSTFRFDLPWAECPVDPPRTGYGVRCIKDSIK